MGTQAGERLQHSPSQSVEQLEDGSFVTRSWLEIMATTTGHDMVAECYVTNEVMDNDFIAFAHVIEILRPPGEPSISGVSHNSPVQHLTCSTQAGNPPASLAWYMGQQMMDSHYQVQGDMVMTTITFVPTDQDKEVTCEASNEALNEPRRKTVVIDVESETSTSQSTTKDALKDNEKTNKESDKDPIDLVGNLSILRNATEGSDTSDYRSENSNMINSKDNDAVVNVNSLDLNNSNDDLGTIGHHLKSEITESSTIPDKHSITISGQNSGLKDKALENIGDRKKDHSEIPTDAVYIPSQKHVSNAKFIKTSVEMTEVNKTDENNKPLLENNTEPLPASSTMNTSCQHKYSFSSLFFSAILVVVSST